MLDTICEKQDGEIMSGINSSRKNKRIGYSGFENLSCFTACLSCDFTVFVPLGQQKAFCKRCGTLTAIRKQRTDEELIDDTMTMLDMRLCN
jgi:uncharacterized paraquat-inducible protein A